MACSTLPPVGGNCEPHVRRQAVEYSFSEATMMRKQIAKILTGVALAGLPIGIIGCTEETGTKEEVKIKTPTGTTTETRDVTVKHSGDNPPAAPSEKVKP